MLKQVAKIRDSLSKAELRLAEAILKQPEAIITMSMVDLKKAADVSDPTILRFCRRLGCNGYPEFKVRLAQGLSPEPPFVHRAIEAGDSVAEAVDKILTNSMNAIKRFASDVDADAVERAADAMLSARAVFLLGLGISETVAFDAEHKLFRLGLHCRTVFDSQRQMLLAPTLRSDEAAVFFSHSGATRTLVSVAAQARENGVATIAITAPQSHLARTCDTVIAVPRYEHSELYTPLTARLNHFLVINMLVVAIGLKQGRRMPDNLTALDPWLTEKFMD
ncbi:MurR/RpiR family transcriptional regulator [Labrys wisconsinensis]|uniref:RpiR family carbohydrate utilization transcriptional regulator n=1 Tax=Labrys wisconsinensis TaxID=425677 RepID=A0ABU0JAP6_9HYPH|nr:SIS domain-containing protein [Labrys wisconsinensis]MDQ0471340.1 RpiR family carbohydrate utilization transcriptional regulator [Labrys wisconsinensis]